MKKTGRVLLVLLVIVVAALLLYPTIRWYFFVPESTKTAAAGSNENIRDYSRGQASRGVRALTSLLQEDRDAAIPEDFMYLRKDAETALKERGMERPEEWTVYTLLSAFPSESALFQAIEDHTRSQLLDAKKLSGNVLQLGLDLRGGMSIVLEADTASYAASHDGEVPSGSELASMLQDDIDILTSRIDQFGVSEPDIRLQGSDQILVEVPGETDPERVDAFLRGRGSLTFQLVDSSLSDRVNREYMGSLSRAFDEDGSIITPSYIPSGYTVAGYYAEDEYGIEELQSFVVLRDEVVLDGSHLVSARMERDQNGRPAVNFRLDSEGADIFYAFTSANIGERLAVVMDGRVKSVATINDAISGDVQLSGSFTEEEAQSLAVILRTSSLPIDLIAVSEQGVGATLGDDSVRIAMQAIAIGFMLVIITMIIYYGPAGIIADVALLLNLVMMVAVLSALHFTLTLSSIAGLVLTLGMAIDANVIIYERIKEEMAAGADCYDSVSLGFGRAFWTIMDSNVTTIIAAIVLSILGSSTVKGFANTLAIGVACSLFTSLFVSHLLFDFFVTDDGRRGVWLSWRRK